VDISSSNDEFDDDIWEALDASSDLFHCQGLSLSNSCRGSV
jgi:hypothetical protein